METVSVDQLVGQTVNNYRIERFVGKGRLNAVYLARNLSSQRLDALTLYLIPDHFSNEARTRFIARFRHHASIMISLSHPALLPVYAFDELLDCPYLVTPYETHGSLADQRKRDGRYEYQTVLSLLEHFVPGIQYAHEKGIIHGTLRPSLIVLSEEGTMQVAGFGLFHILQLAGIEKTHQPYAHLLSIAGTMLTPLEYVAPEVIQGQPVDRRADVYALGCIVFELLSGQPPLTETNPLVLANQRETQKIPSLRLLRPDIPVGVVSVVNQALNRDPDQRFQQVSELIEAFTQASGGAASTKPLPQSPAPNRQTMEHSVSQKTQRQRYAPNTWQLLPPIVTNKMPTVRSNALETEALFSSEPTTKNTDEMVQPLLSEQQSSGETPQRDPHSSTQPPTSATTPPRSSVQQPVEQNSMPGVQDDTSSLVEAYAWWSQSETVSPHSSQSEKMLAMTAQAQQAQEAINLTTSTHMDWASGPFMEAPLSNKKTRGSGKGPRKVRRRRVITTLAAGGVAVVGAAAYFGLKSLSSPALFQTTATNGMPGNASEKKQMPGMDMGNNQSSPQNQRIPKTNMGTLVGQTNQAINTAQPFTNPADGKASLLIHLPNGKFVAYERACTHVGVNVNYDPGSQKLVCPAHGAIFDPANGAKVLQGPATRPLPPVTIRVNGDGMITIA
jgi:serine/threonine protein kinase/Rieske Fe-S protein